MDETDILTTRGITSEVRGDDEIIGHIRLMDYDDGTGFDALFKRIAGLPGLTAVFESSPGAFHVWNTTVKSLDKTALDMLSLKCDPMHVSVGYRRDRWTLRFGAKTQANSTAGSESDAEPYKSAPELVEWFVNNTRMPQSAAHRDLIAACVESCDGTQADAGTVVDRAADRCTGWVGDSYRIEQYITMTDRLKAEVADG